MTRPLGREGAIGKHGHVVTATTSFARCGASPRRCSAWFTAETFARQACRLMFDLLLPRLVGG